MPRDKGRQYARLGSFHLFGKSVKATLRDLEGVNVAFTDHDWKLSRVSLQRAFAFRHPTTLAQGSRR